MKALVKMCGKPKMLDTIKLPPPELYKHVEVNILLSFLLDKQISTVFSLIFWYSSFVFNYV